MVQNWIGLIGLVFAFCFDHPGIEVLLITVVMDSIINKKTNQSCVHYLGHN
jgi:hypothetical protein